MSKLLGHAKTSITLDIYISVMPSQKDDAVKALDLLLSKQEDECNNRTTIIQQSR